MKSQVSSGWAAALASRSWARFSPATVTPASASVPISSSGTYFTAASTSTSAGSRPPPRAPPRLARSAPRPGDFLADAVEVRADRARVEAVDQLRHATPAWRPVTPRSRRWEKKRSGSWIVHSPPAWTVSTPAAVRRSRARALRATRRPPLPEPPPRQALARERLEVDRPPARAERRPHLVADLVAARPRPGADRGGDPAGAQ